jgi:hypothetical protein
MAMKISKAHMKCLEAAEEIDRIPAQEAGQVAFFPTSLIYTTLPCRDPKVAVYLRESNGYRLLISGDPDVGIPFGPHPRLFICWLVTEIVRTKERRFKLGNSFAQFLKSIQLPDDSKTRKSVKNQLLRMQYANIKVGKTDKHSSHVKSYDFFNESEFWWDDKINANQMTLMESFIEVSDNFYQMAINAMPIDLRAVKALKESPKALDVYMWLTLSMSRIQAPLDLSWKQLAKQFGKIDGKGEKTDPELKKELHAFRTNFKPILDKVNLAYPQAQFKASAKGVKLLPSPVHVQKAVKKGSYE